MDKKNQYPYTLFSAAAEEILLMLKDTPPSPDRQPSPKIKVWQVKKVFKRRLLGSLSYRHSHFHCLPTAPRGTCCLLAEGMGKSPCAYLTATSTGRTSARRREQGGRESTHSRLLRTYWERSILSYQLLVNQCGNSRVNLMHLSAIYGKRLRSLKDISSCSLMRPPASL